MPSCQIGKREWFREWFDSPYYHILYKNHDDNEAQMFIDGLSSYLHLAGEKDVLDIGCGNGRHARYLHLKGCNVTGVDLSPHNIAMANEFSTDTLQFFVADMRCLNLAKSFDYILNLFTSFGFFENPEENLQALLSFKKSLKKKGKIVIDFMNSSKVIKSLIPFEVKTVDGIDFHIEKTIEDGYIIKSIAFSDEGKNYCFTEKVNALNYDQFINYFKMAGLRVVDLFGDYNFRKFDIETSDRMIFILEKEMNF